MLLDDLTVQLRGVLGIKLLLLQLSRFVQLFSPILTPRQKEREGKGKGNEKPAHAILLSAEFNGYTHVFSPWKKGII